MNGRDTYRLVRSLGIKFVLNVVVILVIQGNLKSQPVTPAEELEYDIEFVDIPGGQLANNVNSIVQGPNGFMWFGSHGGVHRYDGNQFYTWKNVPSDTIGETTTLSYPYVEHLFWDRFDKLWVCTYGGGLYRFDPITEKFKHFPADQLDSTTISHSRVLSANEDTQGRMWFGTENGLNLFDRESETFKRYYADPDDPNALLDDDIRNIYVDKTGTLWLATGFLWFQNGGGALSKYNPDTDNFTNYTMPPVNEQDQESAVRGLMEDSRGNLWVGTLQGIQRFDREKGTFIETEYHPDQPFAPGHLDRSINPVYSIMEDSRGGLWIGTIDDPLYSSHISRYDPVTQQSQVLPYTLPAWQMTESSDGTIWVAGAGVGGRAGKITRKAKMYNFLKGEYLRETFRNSKTFNDLKINPDCSVSAILNVGYDRNSDNQWVSFVTFGVNRSDLPPAFLTLANWSRSSSEKIEFYPLLDLDISRDVTLPGNAWRGIGLEIDKEGKIWTTTNSENVGIVGFDPATNKIDHIANDPNDSTSLSSNFITELIMDSRGEIWATSVNEGLNRYNPETGEIKNYRFIDYFTFGQNEFPIAVIESKDGKIWAGGEYVDQDGRPFFVVIDPVADTSYTITLPLGGFVQIMSLVQSETSGKIIFSAWGHGIVIYDPKNNQFEVLNPEIDRFSLSDVASIISDDNGNIWMSSSNNGHFVVMDSFNTFRFIRGSLAGLSSRFKSNTKTGDGKLIFPCGPGYYEIDPTEVKNEERLTTISTRFIDLYVFGVQQTPSKNGVLNKPLWDLEEITLPNQSESFGITFSNFNFRNDNPQYQYRLYPYEQNWKLTRGDSRVDYHKLPSGEYTLEVIPVQYSGLTNTETTSLKITMLPPLWRTWWAYLLYGISLLFGGWMVHRYQKEKTIRQERERIKDRELAQAKEIEKAYKELQNTQKQLIHSEKMASLGELTAGIAHEIKNPLNFVNNFAEVNSELLAELKEEIKAGNYDEVAEIATDLEQNELKIQHHGKRADSIVKGMLMHSRDSTSEKIPTDINALADEYLRLAYHGLRAKDKSFNATMNTDFDPSLSEAHVIPQDFGRVLLNLITNAFHACTEKRKLHLNNGYSPTVSVQTKKAKESIEVHVSDNGNGIPSELKGKIFQPFFTTKPSGEGTGLGLSISYDIITKGHDGELKVDSEEGVGTTFIIKIPNKK